MLSALIVNVVLLLLWPIRRLRAAFASPVNGYVVLTIEGRVVDHRSPKRFRLSSLLSQSAPPPLSVAMVRQLVSLVEKDQRVKGLVVRVEDLSAGPSVLASLRRVLGSVRASGKELIFDLPRGADNATLYLASVGKRVVAGPETTIAPIGYAAESHYVRGLLEKVGVKAEVFAKGTHKAAGEPLVRDDMSEAQREQLGELLSAQHSSLVEALAERTGGDRERARQWIDEAPYRANEALRLGLVDDVAYEDQLDAMLSDDPAEGAPCVDAEDYLSARRPTRFRPLLRRRFVGIVEVHGPIVSMAHYGFGPIAVEEQLVALLRAARQDRRLAAVVLHIDSPGGSALASDRIHHEVERLAEVKPIVAYLSNVAASGGYYIAAGARRIIAEAEVVTGSIGVVATHFVLQGLFQKLGVTTEVLKRGARADLLSAMRPVDEAERRVMEAELEGFYRTFLSVVARGRGRAVEEIERLAEGRVYSGRRALALGLVDELGSSWDAVRVASSLAGIPLREPVVLRPPEEPMPPQPLLAAASTLAEALGVGFAARRASLVLGLRATERVLAYAPWLPSTTGSDGRTAR